MYYYGVKRTQVCLLHFRREDSQNYLNRRIPERKVNILENKCIRWRDLTILRSGTFVDEMFTRGRMFSQSSRSCVQEFELCHKSSNFWKTTLSFSRNPSTSCQKRSRARANTMLEYLHALSLSEPCSSYYFLSSRQFLR